MMPEKSGPFSVRSVVSQKTCHCKSRALFVTKTLTFLKLSTNKSRKNLVLLRYLIIFSDLDCNLPDIFQNILNSLQINMVPHFIVKLQKR